MRLGGLATACAGALLMTSVFLNTLGTEGCLAGAFALCALHVYRTRNAGALLSSATLLIVCGLAHLQSAYPYNGCELGLALWTFAAASVYLLLARRLEEADVAYLSMAALAGGAGLFLQWQIPMGASRPDFQAANALWIAGSALMAGAYLHAARWSQRANFTVAAALAMTFAYLRLLATTLHPAAVWYGLLLLPFLIGLHLAGRRRTNAEALFGAPLRQVAITLSGLALLWAIGVGDARPATTFAVTLTLAAYGSVYAALALCAARRAHSPPASSP